MIVFFLFCFVIFQRLYAQGCSQCKLLAEQGSELDESSFGENINFGILYLMVIPYLLILFLFRKKIIALLKKIVFRKTT